MTIRISRCAFSLALVLSLCAACLGQAGLADMQGVVLDKTGAAIASAQVKLRNMESGNTRSVTAGADGHYDFPQIQPGRYGVSAEAAGFSKGEITNLVLELDNHVVQNIPLAAGDAGQTVEVTGEVSAVDQTAYDIGGVINQVQINTLPIPGRQYLNLSLLVPGTTQDATRTFYNNVQSGGGQYYYANGFYLDGVSNQWSEQGEPRQNIPQGSVDQFKTYTAQFPSEFGWAMGGFTSVVTKRGTNRIHGEVFEYFRNQAFNGDNYYQRQTEIQQGVGKAPYNRNQFGGEIGGKIFQDRTHYFGAFERTQESNSYTNYIASPTIAANYSSLLGTFNAPNHDQMLVLRLDHDLSAKQQIFARYAQEWNLKTRQGCGGTSTYSCYDGSIPRHSIVVGHTWEPTSSILNDARFQYAYASYQLGPYGTAIPHSVADLTSPSFLDAVGIGYRFPSFSYGETYSAVGIESRWQINDAVSITKGRHAFKMGFDLSYIPYVDASAVNLKGTYTFTTDQKFDPTNTSNLVRPSLFTAALKPLVYYLPSTQTSYFFQDTWKLRRNVTANLGLRYDREYGASFLDTLDPTSFARTIPFQGDPRKRGDRDNFGPRIGFTWDPRSKGAEVLRIGYGVYYNNIQTEQGEAEKLNLYACTVSINSPVYGSPYGNQSPTSYCSTTTPTVTVLAPGYSNPYTQQFSVGFSRQFTPALSVSVDGLYEHSLRNYKNYDLNYPTNYPTSSVRPVAGWNQIIQHASTDQDKYKALLVHFDRRFERRYMYTLSYTLASGQDWNPEATVTDYNNLKSDFGPSSIDRRHAVVASGSVLVPFHILVGGIYTYRSATPFSVTTAAVINANGTSQYVPGTTRDQGNRGISYDAINAYRTTYNASHPTATCSGTVTSGCLSTNLSPDSINSTRLTQLDLRVSKSFFEHEQRKLEVIGQAFNILGFRNNGSPTTSAISGSFGQSSTAGIAQQGEVAVRYTF